MAKTARIQVRLDPETKSRIEHMARAQKRSVSFVAADIIAVFLAMPNVRAGAAVHDRIASEPKLRITNPFDGNSRMVAGHDFPLEESQ